MAIGIRLLTPIEQVIYHIKGLATLYQYTLIPKAANV